jgi:hypothetical protein
MEPDQWLRNNEGAMVVVADRRAWAEQTFGNTELGNISRTRRLIESANMIAAHPEKSFTQIFDWNQLRGFYRLCNRTEATLSSIMQPHWEQTREQMSRNPLVLILHDTSELDFTSHTALKGTGSIGDGNGRGFLQHNSLAILPHGRQVVGLAYQQLYERQPAPVGETAAQARARERESVLWLEGIRGTGQAPEGSCWVDVGDRGSDFYEAMIESRKWGHHFLFRLCQDRTVFTTAEKDETGWLLKHARSLPSQGSDRVEIPSRGGRKARSAKVQFAAARVEVPAPSGTPQRWAQPTVEAWVIRVWEVDAPADVEEPLEWLLLCSLPTATLEQMKERRDWYACRWMVEMYHDIEKNGCSLEDRRFKKAAGMKACLAILSLVAVRVFQLRCALDGQPDAPAGQVGTEEEIQVIRKLTRHRGKSFTVRDFVRGVAKLGGFLGRKSDGNPGIRALWRGYQRLQDLLLGFRLRADLTGDDEGG